MSALPQRAVLWLRNDLRLHDHEILAKWADKLEILLPVYCFDPRQFTDHPLGFPKTGPFRARFLFETLTDLQTGFEALGCGLHVAIGKPEQIIPRLVHAINADVVFAESEVTAEEAKIEQCVAAALKDTALHMYQGRTLVHPDDLPFSTTKLPEVYTPFRKTVEAHAPIRTPFPRSERLPAYPDEIEPGPLPNMTALGLSKPVDDPRAVMRFIGGETKGLGRLNDYLWGSRAIVNYKKSRNGLVGERYSSKFSPWLACGALSPRLIYFKIKQFEQEVLANDSTYWLVFELLWRDYFRFVAMKHGNRIFRLGGILGKAPSSNTHRNAFQRWCRGVTGEPFIDANMRELANTGFMSNRGRQNVASYLCHDLGVDWRWGAAWFESQLIDYDVCSNQGNWMYIAGVGNDPRHGRRFNVRRQAERYDPDNTYTRRWLTSSDKFD